MIETIPDLRPPKIKESFFRNKKMVEVDSDPDNFYEKLLTEEEQEAFEVEPK